MLDVVVATLQGDAALNALLTGGIYSQQVVNEISRQGTPAISSTAQRASSRRVHGCTRCSTGNS